MYTEFYNLKEKPFNLTPSPRFLYLGEIHKEALALLTYGVVERKGFILLTGEVGTGKTTIIQALLAKLDRDVQVVYISNPLFSQQDFMDYLAFATFKKKVRFRGKSEFLIEFEAFLKECLQHQRNFILIVDEAQKLSYELLEEIRLLSNMETADEKLINIFLVGQPELNEKLSEPRCRPLLQRISVRYHIRPLDPDAVSDYVLARMRIAGSREPSKIFPKNTISTLHRLSGGYPRMINVLADNALLLGYTRESKKITPTMIEECHEDMRLSQSLPEKPERTPQPPPRKKARTGVGKWRLALMAGAVLLLIAMLGLTVRDPQVARRLKALLPVSDRPVLEHRRVEPPAPKVEEPSIPQESPTVAQVSPMDADTSPGQQTETGEGGKVTQEMPRAFPTERAEPAEALAHADDKAKWSSVIVKVGDTLTELAIMVYGRVDERILEFVKDNNPDMKDVNRIEVGQKILFPPLGISGKHLTYTVHVASFKPFAFAKELFDRLLAEGYEAYIIPVNDPQKGKIYRVTLGSFEDPQRAESHSKELLSKGATDYARVIQVEMR